MSRRRRLHPARRARRAAGATLVGAYAALLVTVGWAQRATDADVTAPVPTPEAPERATFGVERLDLRATATIRPLPTNPSAGSLPTASPASAPVPPPPPSLAVTTTAAPRVTTPPTMTTVVAASAPVTTSAPTTTAAPATTAPPTTSPPTTVPPPTTLPTSGS